jgi:predicted DCC family thiol-disulfide oxidoreductase YuxK
MMHRREIQNKHLVIFDGVCNLCNGTVNFIIKRDPAAKFIFLPMQSDLAREILIEHGQSKRQFQSATSTRLDAEFSLATDTLVLVKNGHCYVRSNAALQIASELSGFWHLLNVLRIFPRPIRDWGYRVVARNRYAIWGKTDHCMVPTAAVRARFVGSERQT